METPVLITCSSPGDVLGVLAKILMPKSAKVKKY